MANSYGGGLKIVKIYSANQKIPNIDLDKKNSKSKRWSKDS